MSDIKIPAVSPGRVLVVDDAPSKVSAGGVLLPDTASEQHTSITGRVVGNGGWAKNEYGNVVEYPFKVGSKVYYNRHTGTKIKIDGIEFRCMSHFDIFLTDNSDIDAKADTPK